MKTVTFYSYKGGVGRTLALANIAVYLSRFGQNICLVDFDLEAPGLLYKLPEFFSPDAKQGLVDYIYEFVETGQVPSKIEDFSLTAKKLPDSWGKIDVIPAGNIFSSEYWKKLASLDWHDLFYSKEGEGIPFFLELKEKIFNEINPDFLLIDSRTGITEMSGVCTTLLADQVVFLITNNRENLDGSRQVMRGLAKGKRLVNQPPVKFHLALTRIPFPEDDDDQDIENELTGNILSFFNEPADELQEQLYIPGVSILHSDREIELSETIRLNQENFIEKPLSRDYLNLFSNIVLEEDIMPGIKKNIDHILEHDRLLPEPERALIELEKIAEVYPCSYVFEKLIDLYLLQKVGNNKILTAFSKLWETNKSPQKRLLEKLAKIVENPEIYPDLGKSHLQMIELYLSYEPTNKNYLERLLVEIYNCVEDYENAIKYSIQILKKNSGGKESMVGILSSILDKILDLDKRLEVYTKYWNMVLKFPLLKAHLIETLFLAGHKEKIPIIWEKKDTSTVWPHLLRKNGVVCFAISLMVTLEDDWIYYHSEKFLQQAINEEDREMVFQIGKVFRCLDRYTEFIHILPEDFDDKQEILDQLCRSK